MLVCFVDLAGLETGMHYLYFETDFELPVCQLVEFLVIDFEGLDAVEIFFDEYHSLLDVYLLVLHEMLQPELFGQIQHQ